MIYARKLHPNAIRRAAQVAAYVATFLFLFSISARAGDSHSAPLQVQQIDPDFDVQKMAAPGTEVHTQSELVGKAWKLPSTEARDRLFYQAGLRPYVTKWDQLDKDRLFISARDSSSKRLTDKYPNLPSDDLLALSKLVKETDQSK